MAALTPTNQPIRHVVGDYVLHHLDLSGNNGDTYTVPFPEQVAQVDITPTTAIAVGATRSGGVITFVTLGAWAARITTWTRVG
jgi:hypothetical protein